MQQAQHHPLPHLPLDNPICCLFHAVCMLSCSRVMRLTMKQLASRSYTLGSFTNSLLLMALPQLQSMDSKLFLHDATKMTLPMTMPSSFLALNPIETYAACRRSSTARLPNCADIASLSVRVYVLTPGEMQLPIASAFVTPRSAGRPNVILKCGTTLSVSMAGRSAHGVSN